jgi:hypothetical protein
MSTLSGASRFAPGGCFPTTPQCGPRLDDLTKALQQLGELVQFLQQCQNLFKQHGGQRPGQDCGPTPPDCRPTPPDCRPTPPRDCGPTPPDCGPSWPTTPRCPPTPPHCPPQGKDMKMWDVFFDAKTGTKTTQKSPIVLDLNGNGKADITGGNIKGNGKLEGKTVKGFDLDPSNRQWTTKSEQRRPGKGAPELPAGTKVEVFDAQGKKVKSLDASALDKAKAKKGDMGLGLGKGMRAEFRGPDGKLVGELKTDAQKNKLMYHFGNVNENEWTKAWDKKNGGDGILAWDVDGDGKISSGKEIFGHVDLDGKNRFSNGYEKLSKYFDKDGNGRVEGNELKGLKIWEDRNGDGVTDKGELVDLASRGVTRLSTSHNPYDMSSTFQRNG